MTDTRQQGIERLLWDLVTDDDSVNAYQSTAITALAALLAQQEQQIAKLQQQIDELKKEQTA